MSRVSSSIMSTGQIAHAQKVASLLERNRKYAETHQAPPALKDGVIKNVAAGGRTMIIISCSDPRVLPTEYMNFGRGESAMIINAGGRTADAIRSIMALDALGNLGTIMIIHHTDCGMTHFTGEEFREKTQLKHPDLITPNTKFWEITDPYKTVLEDMRHLKSIKSFETNGTEIRGFVLNIKTGLMTEAEL